MGRTTAVAFITLASDEVEGVLGNPAYLAVGDAHLAPFLEAAVPYFHLASFVKDEEVVAVVGRCALDRYGWSRDDSACMGLLKVLLLQGADVGKHGEE